MLAAYIYDPQDDYQRHSCRISTAPYQPEQARPLRQQPLVDCVVVLVDFCIIYYYYTCKNSKKVASLASSKL